MISFAFQSVHFKYFTTIKVITVNQSINYSNNHSQSINQSITRLSINHLLGRNSTSENILNCQRISNQQSARHSYTCHITHFCHEFMRELYLWTYNIDIYIYGNWFDWPNQGLETKFGSKYPVREARRSNPSFKSTWCRLATAGEIQTKALY